MSIQEEFEKEIINKLWDFEKGKGYFIRTDIILQFITSKLEAIRDEVVGECEDEGGRQSKEEPDTFYPNDQFNEGYNQKREEVKEVFNKHLKENTNEKPTK